MAPIACILIHDFPLAALVRANPAVRDNPFAISRGQGPRAILEFVSPMARQAGVIIGMTAAQATALVPDLIVAARSAAAERSACDAMLDAAESFSPLVEENQPGR